MPGSLVNRKGLTERFSMQWKGLLVIAIVAIVAVAVAMRVPAVKGLLMPSSS